MTAISQPHPPVSQLRQHPARRWLRRVAGIFIIGVLLITLVSGGFYITAAANLATAPAAPVTAQTTQFDGRYLLALSDADMIASAYADGRLQQIPGDTDTLSILELPVTNSQPRLVELPVSNSVASWPQIVAVAPDGMTIYVVEAFGQVDDTVEQLPVADLPAGRRLSVIDLSGGIGAASVTTVEVGQDPLHVALSADGAYLAVGLREAGRQLAILPTAALDDPATFRYVSVLRSNGQPTDEVSSVHWHPSGDFLAVNITAEELQFYRVTPDAAGAPTLAPHGDRILGGYTLTYGQFTRDGQFYLTSEINWDRFPPPLRNLINPPSEMLSIRFDASDAAQHAIVSRIPVGQSAESWAINPAEDLVVTVDMGRTYLPDGLAFWPGATMNTLSLLTFDRVSGVLTPVGERYGFEGVLPESARFDADGDSLGVVIYNERETPLNPGYIEFWNVMREGDMPRLARTAVRVPLVRGSHMLELIP